MTEVLAEQGSRLTPRRVQTRERLMAAAISVFAERGIIGASVEEICESAGFTRGAFYSNFSDKDELVIALLLHEITTQYTAAEQAIAAMKAVARPAHGAEELVSVALAAYEKAGQMSRDWVMTQQELLLYAARVAKVRDAYLAFSAQCLEQFSTLIGDAINYAGLEFTVSFEDAITLLSATYGHMHMQALLSGTPSDFGQLRVLILAITDTVQAAP